MARPRRILFATDFTEASAPAFREALSMAVNGTELILAHAYHVPEFGAEAISPAVYDDWERRLRADAISHLEVLVAEAKARGVDAVPLVLCGDAYQAIVDAAKDRAVDLVVVGTHGRRGISRLFLGSVASRVIASAPCPVLTVRAA